MSETTTRDTVRKIIHGMASRLDKNASRAMDAVIQFEISGDGGGEYALSIRDQACAVAEGGHTNANATMKMSVETFIDLALGRTTGSQAFYRRKLRFNGDLNLVMKIHKLFPSVSIDEASANSA
ncbi:MAG: SCP2 sterol-binding domain-containing protein [Henriciella sp.]|nr:SCP2 sterol-binding domain-containing protein [Hyphomonadaceae bacterium]